MGTITLSNRKAFPGAFGYGENAVGGREGAIIEVTNLDDTGEGSLRWALTRTYPRTILIRVSGVVNLDSSIVLNNTHKDYTLLGQTAVGGGLTVTGGSLETAPTQSIIRFLTWRSNSGTPGTNDAIQVGNSTGPIIGYFDHISASYGFDEIMSIRANSSSARITAAFNLLAEPHPSHTRGSIMGTIGAGDLAYTNPMGKFTHALNFYYNTGARFPNGSGFGGVIENYNNVISNWNGRLNMLIGDHNYDWYNNYHFAGNIAKTTGADAPALNKLGIRNDGMTEDIKIFSRNNIVEGFQDTPVLNENHLWHYFYDLGSGRDRGVVVDSKYFVESRLGDASHPLKGVLTALQTPSYVFENAGNYRGTDFNGEPIIRRDSLDSSYISKTLNGTTEASYRSQASFNIPIISSGTQYPDDLVQHLPNAWATKHGITSATQVRSTYNFDDYTVINDAGYTALEIWASYIAGDFERMTVTPEPSISIGLGVHKNLFWAI